MTEYSSRRLLVISVISFVIYLVIALAFIRFAHDGGLAGVFSHGFSIPLQILAGTAAGCMAAGLILFLAVRTPLSNVLVDYFLVKEVVKARFTPFDRIQISLFAGVGEEFLFRGAVQPVLGIWLTSVIFIAIHGYFKFGSAGHLLFGALMFGLSMFLGVLFIYAGLIAAMAAHAAYDMILLKYLKPGMVKGQRDMSSRREKIRE